MLSLTRTTSIGVLAKAPAKPATNDAMKCVPIVSELLYWQINCFFIQSYTANSTPHTIAARWAVGKTPCINNRKYKNRIVNLSHFTYTPKTSNTFVFRYRRHRRKKSFALNTWMISLHTNLNRRINDKYK
jgi:hypothetical protein